MVHKIALFNHKSGVGKTTTTFNLGWMLASKGKRVILVDTDPQCNLTGMVLGLSTKQDLEEIYKRNQDIKSGLAPAFESQPRLINAVDCIPDMSPSLSSINQNLLMTSNFFILPTIPDFFSVMAIDSLATILPKWHHWAKKASELRILKEADYPFPKVTPLFLGTIIQNYRIKYRKPSAAFQKWIDRIQNAISDEVSKAI